jgi:hypothetical protein
VQLFNAVQKHQKNVDEKVKEAGGSMRKRAKLISTVSKKDFISVLRGMDGNTNQKSSTGKTPIDKQVRLYIVLVHQILALQLKSFEMQKKGGE